MTPAAEAESSRLLRELVAAFDAAPSAAARSLRRLLHTAPSALAVAAAPALRGLEGSPGGRLVTTMLVRNGLLFAALCAGSGSLEDDIALARAAARGERGIDVVIARELWQAAAAGTVDDQTICRVMEVLHDVMRGPRVAILLHPLLGHANPGVRCRAESLIGRAAAGEGPRAALLLNGFLSHKNPRIRSKAALLIGRANQNGLWVQRLLGSPDARIRANALEALWHGPPATCRPAFLKALEDPNCRVAANAVLGLYLLGDLRSLPLAVGMAGHPDPAFRAAAVWLMGESQDPRFLPLLHCRLRESNGKVRQNILRAISRLRQKVAQFAAAGEVELEMAALEPLEGGGRRLRVAAADALGAEREAMHPLCFSIAENGQAVWEYNVAETPPPAVLAVGWAIPGDAGDATAGAIAAALAASSRFRRANDRWGLLGYTSREPVTARERQPEAVFSLDSLSGGPCATHCRLGEGAWAAARRLLRTVAGEDGNRHVLVVEDPDHPVPEPAGGDAQEAVAEALVGRTALHAVCRAGSALERMAQSTGGRSLAVETPTQIPAACSRILLGLRARYTITYRAAGATGGPADIAVVVCGTRGTGACTATLEG